MAVKGPYHQGTLRTIFLVLIFLVLISCDSDEKTEEYNSDRFFNAQYDDKTV